MSNLILFGMNVPRAKSPSGSPSRSLLSPNDARGHKREASASSNSSVSSTEDRFDKLHSKLQDLDPALAAELDELKTSHQRGRARRKEDRNTHKKQHTETKAELDGLKQGIDDLNESAAHNMHAAQHNQQIAGIQEQRAIKAERALEAEKARRRTSLSGGSPLRKDVLVGTVKYMVNKEERR